MNYRAITAGFALLFPCMSITSTAQDRIISRPVEIDDALMNPGIGFTTFQMFNGDNLPYYDVINEADISQYDQKETLDNKGHPITSLAYFRIQWKFIEPEQGRYRWDFIDELLRIAKKRNQKLTLRISPYKGKPGEDVPAWYRKMVGEKRTFAHSKWVVDAEDPRYAKYFGGMIRALAERYDGHPYLENVDLSIVGHAGEGGGTELLSDEAMKNLVTPYLEGFTKTPLIALLHGKRQIEYIKKNAARPVGWRQDCLGDLGFWAAEQNGWTHMFDYYPQTIIEYQMQDAWKEGHVSFEMCGLFRNWDVKESYSEKQVQYIIDQSLKWHISSFNGKSSPVPAKWKKLMDEWLKKMGYRFVLRRFSYPATMKVNSRLQFESWWENKGVAPCYNNYRFAIRLKNEKYTETFLTDADIRKWLPGDIVHNDACYPQLLPPGEYEVAVTLLDPHLLAPAVQLAIEGKQKDGWYPMGKIRLTP